MLNCQVRMGEWCEVDLPDLEQMVLGGNALLGDNSESRRTSSEYPYHFNSTFIMRSGDGMKE